MGRLNATLAPINSLPMFCISIGLVLDGKPIVGVVHNPSSDELFSAAAGCGATLNGKPIAVDNTTTIAQCLCVTEFAGEARVEETLALTKKLVKASHSVRMFGSAAMDLCFVAAGRIDVFVMRWINCWDIAAGVIIVEEAGGFCMDYDLSSATEGIDVYKGEIIAAPSKTIGLQIHALI